MQTFLSLCEERYSVRSFLDKVPTIEDIDYICECIRMAPSAVNFQPFKTKYVTDAEELKKLQKCYAREWFTSVPACFIFYRNKEEEWIRKCDQKPHGDIDVAIAIEHLCLAATERGLGTCWVCNYDPTLLEENFPTPDNLEAVALIPIGYPASKEIPVKKRKDLESILL